MTPEPLSSDRAYTREQLRIALGVGEGAITELRRAGLPYRILGRRAIFLGREVVDALARLPRQDQQESADADV